MENKTALFIGAHTDDIESGCGGFMQRFENKYCVVFSPAIQSIPKEFSQDATRKEQEASWQLSQSIGQLYELPVREFDKHRQDILELLVKVEKELMPDIVFTHASSDIHQDHQVVYNETVRAFKDTSILGYCGIDCEIKKVNYFVKLSKYELDEKLKYMSCFESQLAKKDFLKMIKLNAEYFGLLLNTNYVEPYEMIRWIE